MRDVASPQGRDSRCAPQILMRDRPGGGARRSLPGLARRSVALAGSLIWAAFSHAGRQVITLSGHIAARAAGSRSARRCRPVT